MSVGEGVNLVLGFCTRGLRLEGVRPAPWALTSPCLFLGGGCVSRGLHGPLVYSVLSGRGKSPWGSLPTEAPVPVSGSPVLVSCGPEQS